MLETLQNNIILLSMLSFIISLAVSVCAAIVFIPMLRRFKAAQPIREDGPSWHKSKQGTPTIGGIIFISGILVSSFVVGYIAYGFTVFSYYFMLAFALIFAFIGFMDDYEKVKKKQNLGLRASTKFLFQLLVAIGFIFIMHFNDRLSTELYIPFFNISFYIPRFIYYIFAAFVIIGTVNSVNITDGVDGLATGVTIPVAISITFIGILWSDIPVAFVSAALVGGLVAFLIFNFHPAKVMMGDTGSMFLGGLVCALVFASDVPLLLVTLGFVYFVETLSDIVQVTYFKITKGKRILKMAPIHHHFEMCGWSEKKIFFVFTLVSSVFALISYFGVVNRF